MIRVLIVDDKSENLYLLRSLLQGHGCAVDEARHGAEALNKARQAPPDLIISDLLMPVMDGYTLLRQWKADEQLQTIPFVVYTATYTEPEDERLALDLGADAFIVKPVEPEPFMGLVLEVLAKKGRGELPSSMASEGHKPDLLKEYSEVLVHKLEQKLFQLEQVNHALKEEMGRRQQAEAELREARQDWENIFQATGHPTVILDLEHRIIAANRKCAEITGKSVEELLNAKCHEVFPTNCRRPPHCTMQTLPESGSTDKTEMELEVLGGYYLVTCTPVFDQEGNIRKVIHAATDITQRRETERELRNSENRFRRIYDEAPVMMHSIDRDRVLRNVNKKWLQTLGYERDEVLGNTVDLIMTPESRASLQEILKEFWSVGEVRDVPYEYVKKDGTVLNVILDSIVWDDPTWGQISLSAIRDVTQRRMLQRQLLQAQKMEAIGTLAGGVAHDFNNILQIALGYSELILGDKGLPRRYKADIQKINEASRRGADLVERLLTFSRKTEPKRFPLNLNRRIRELRKMLERTIPKMIEIQLSLAENLATINADATQVDQVLMNLAVNARSAMPDGGRLIFETENVFLDEEYVASYLHAEPGQYVLLTVTDTGCGMEAETLEHVFEPFYTKKGIGEGTGLGLSTVYGIVRQHGGHIRCYSEPGHGTTFKIYFPALVSEERLEEEPTRPPPRGGSESILLVDDEEPILDLGSRILTNAGYEVITASNGKEALDIYERRSDEIALVILDLIMPKMGGRQCLEALLDIDPSMKAVIASGYSADAMTMEIPVSGAKGFIKKPYAIRQLLEAVREVLDAE